MMESLKIDRKCLCKGRGKSLSLSWPLMLYSKGEYVPWKCTARFFTNGNGTPLGLMSNATADMLRSELRVAFYRT